MSQITDALYVSTFHNKYFFSFERLEKELISLGYVKIENPKLYAKNEVSAYRLSREKILEIESYIASDRVELKKEVIITKIEVVV